MKSIRVRNYRVITLSLLLGLSLVGLSLMLARPPVVRAATTWTVNSTGDAGDANQFNGNFGNAEMVKAFIFSGEYRNRFGP